MLPGECRAVEIHQAVEIHCRALRGEAEEEADNYRVLFSAGKKRSFVRVTQLARFRDVFYTEIML